MNAVTSLKLPRSLKARIKRICQRAGESTHALMLRAIERHVEAEERLQAYLDDGVQADEAMRRSGLGFAAADVHTYLAVRAEGRTAGRPKPIRWCE